MTVPHSHDLKKLHAQCSDLGLVVPGLKRMRDLLLPENKYHGYRYYSFRHSIRPEIGDLRSVVDSLLTRLDTVAAEVGTEEAPSVVFKFIIHRPESK